MYRKPHKFWVIHIVPPTFSSFEYPVIEIEADLGLAFLVEHYRPF
jgi:hypothetical protein